MPRIESLPIWAQDKIHLLERDLATAQSRINQIGSTIDGRIVVTHLNDRIAFPGDEEVCFFVNNDPIAASRGVNRRHWLHARILRQDESHHDELLVHGDEPLTVSPESSNSIRVRVIGFSGVIGGERG